MPLDMRPLHQELLRLRMQLFAHTDLSFREPQVARWRMRGGTMFGLAFRHGSLELLDRRAPRIHDLVGAVMDNLAAKIADLESRIEETA